MNFSKTSDINYFFQEFEFIHPINYTINKLPLHHAVCISHFVPDDVGHRLDAGKVLFGRRYDLRVGQQEPLSPCVAELHCEAVLHFCLLVGPVC